MSTDVPRMFPPAAPADPASRAVSMYPQVGTGRAGGARTHDRRIMSPDRQQLLAGQLTWAETKLGAMLLRSISARIWHDKGHAAGEEAAEVR